MGVGEGGAVGGVQESGNGRGRVRKTDGRKRTCSVYADLIRALI